MTNDQYLGLKVLLCQDLNIMSFISPKVDQSE